MPERCSHWLLSSEVLPPQFTLSLHVALQVTSLAIGRLQEEHAGLSRSVAALAAGTHFVDVESVNTNAGRQGLFLASGPPEDPWAMTSGRTK